MARIKGTDLAVLRSLIRKGDSSSEDELLRGLSPQLRELYLSTNPTARNPVELQAELYEAVARVLYPDRPEPVVEMHKVLAQQSYNGVYKAFIRILDLQQIAKRAAVVWSQYYDTGEASAENITATSLDFVVRNFPDLPRALRDATTGHLWYLAKITGTKDLEIKAPGNTPAAWVWELRWRP